MNPLIDTSLTGIKEECHDFLQWTDARWFARFLRLGGLPEGSSSPKAQRPVRAVFRQRQHLVTQQTAHVLSLQHLLLRNTGGRLSGERIKRLSLAEGPTRLPHEEQALAVSRGLAVIHWLAEQLQRGEKRVQTQSRSTPLDQLLHTVSGSGPMFAQTMLLAPGASSRFPRVGDSASSGRGVDSTKLSPGKRNGHGTVKHGPPSLSGASAAAATFALRLPPRVPRDSQRKQAKPSVPVAHQTVAHTLARAC